MLKRVVPKRAVLRRARAGPGRAARLATYTLPLSRPSYSPSSAFPLRAPLQEEAEVRQQLAAAAAAPLTLTLTLSYSCLLPDSARCAAQAAEVHGAERPHDSIFICFVTRQYHRFCNRR